MNKIILPSLLLIMLLSAFGAMTSAQCVSQIGVDPPNGSNSLTVQFTGKAGLSSVEYACDIPTLPAGWSSTPFTIGSPCQIPDGSSPDNSDYLWVGGRDGAGKRWIETADMDLTAGGEISFEIRYGVDPGSYPGTDCPGPNSTAEGVELQYSTNNGADWTRITYYMPLSTDTIFTSWNSFSYQVPAAAQTTHTRFRWFQNKSSREDSDKWGLNNIAITNSVTVTSWEWDFGDLTTSDQQNPQHTYAAYGVYNVSLTIITSDACTDTDNLDLYVNSIPTIDDLIDVEVNSTGTNVEIELTGITDGGVGGQELSLSALSSNPSSLAIASVDYTSPATTGIIRVTPDSLSCGDATITARAEYTNLTNNFYDELFTVYVKDKTLPWITCPDDIVSNIPEGECTSMVTYTVEFGDNCPGVSIEQTEGLASGSLFPSGTTTNTFVVTDAEGNEVTSSFTVSISENVPPTITCGDDITGSECNNYITITPPVASDDCGVESVTHNSPFGSSNTDASGNYPVGTTIITWTATDFSGNTATCEQEIIIVPNPVLPDAPDIEVAYGEEAILTATPDPDHFIRWYELSDLSDTPVESGSVNLGNLTPGTYLHYATQVSEITGCEGLAKAVEAVVTKATLTVTAEDATKSYGDPNPPLLFSYEGFVFGEGRDILNEEPLPVTDAGEMSDAGDYPIYFTGGEDDNYSFSFVNGTLTIEKIDHTISLQPLPEGLRVTESYPIEATASSGLPVTFSASESGMVSFSGSTMTVLREGTVTIIASSAGNINYNPAPDLSQVIHTLPAFDNSKSLFTPNGDGRNDYWHIPFIDQLGRTDVKVFNRHGKLVFEAQGYANDWDGTSNGKPLPEGSYYYVIDSVEKGIIKGVINIVR